ncbi:MAG: prolyl-tRNA synthetase associated domain-containing protein [Tissierellia bacterium]|nr:prolyl-tRNA synthetase associated domain-containing protein [Tissierellia bacterium]
MKKQEVYEFLNDKKIWHEIDEHEAVFTMEDLEKVDLKYPNLDAKNLFVRDDKKKNYYLISVKANKRVDLKEFKKRFQTRRLSFSSDKDLMEKLKLMPGSVSPLGILNNTDKDVIFYLDKEFLKEPSIIGVHPNENTAMVWLKTQELIDLIKEHGNIVHVVEL